MFELETLYTNLHQIHQSSIKKTMFLESSILTAMINFSLILMLANKTARQIGNEAFWYYTITFQYSTDLSFGVFSFPP